MYAVKMRQPQRINGVREDLSLRDALIDGRRKSLDQRARSFSVFLQRRATFSRPMFMRKVISPADREVTVLDPFTGSPRRMLMFGSNNYLGLANHPHVVEKVRRTVAEYGIGVGGPPLLNGTTGIHRELEERLAAFKGTEDALLFPTGYSANLGMISGLAQPGDTVIHDTLSHASFRDGLRLTRAANFEFPHNDVAALERQIDRADSAGGEIFVGVEGVYSMDGDLAELDRIAALARRKGAVLMLDDAHGTGVMGPSGRGTAEHFGLHGKIDVTMGTFSKAFSVTGGFVAASTPIVNYLRFFARSHMFSASLPPMVAAAVLAGMDVIENEPERLANLHANVAYLEDQLRRVGVDVEIPSAILALRVPVDADMFGAALKLHEAGLFVNPVVYPAVPANQQRFRISLMATHTREDLDRLVACLAELTREWGVAHESVDRK